MREALREIPQRGSRVRIALFAEQADVICERQQVFERPLGFVRSTAMGQIFDGPKSANPERAFGRGEAVIAVYVAVDDPAASEPLDDSFIRGNHPRIGRVQVT